MSRRLLSSLPQWLTAPAPIWFMSRPTYFLIQPLAETEASTNNPSHIGVAVASSLARFSTSYRAGASQNKSSNYNQRTESACSVLTSTVSHTTDELRSRLSIVYRPKSDRFLSKVKTFSYERCCTKGLPPAPLRPRTSMNTAQRSGQRCHHRQTARSLGRTTT